MLEESKRGREEGVEVKGEQAEKRLFAKIIADRARDEALGEIRQLEKIMGEHIYTIGSLVSFLLAMQIPQGSLYMLRRDIEKLITAHASTPADRVKIRDQILNSRYEIEALVSGSQVGSQTPLIVETSVMWGRSQYNAYIWIAGAAVLEFPLRYLSGFSVQKLYDHCSRSMLQKQRYLSSLKTCTDVTQIRMIAGQIKKIQQDTNRRLEDVAWWIQKAHWVVMACYLLYLPIFSNIDIYNPDNSRHDSRHIRDSAVSGFVSILSLLFAVPGLMIRKRRKNNFETNFSEVCKLLGDMTHIESFRHSWSHDKKDTLHLSSFTLQIEGYGNLNPYVVCQTFKNALFQKGISFTAGKVTITIDGGISISKKTATELNKLIAGTLERLVSFPKLEDQMRDLTEALCGDPKELTAIIFKDPATNLPLKKFIIPISEEYQEIFSDKERLDKLFGASYILGEDALFVTGHQPYDRTLLAELCSEIASVRSASSPADSKNKGSRSSASSSAAEVVERKRAPRRGPAQPAPQPVASAPRTINLGQYGVYNPADQKSQIVRLKPGLFFDVSKTSRDVKEQMKRGKLVRGPGDQGPRLFDQQYRAQFGDNVIGDVKLLGKGGKGEMRALLFFNNKYGPKGEMPCDVGQAKKVKHT